MADLSPTLVYSVSQLTQIIKEDLLSDLELCGVWVRGEIGTFKCHFSGHIYFTLKDKDSLLRCVMFRRYASLLRFQLDSGLGVLALGQINVYERDGVYQLYVQELQPDGLGAQYLALEQSKKRLAEEGLLAAERKRPLPSFPRRVAIVTSPVGAALQDIMAVAQRRFPSVEILLCPVLVQGPEAAAQIVLALEQLNEIHGIDVVILARGGGSQEDLWSFNDEKVARQVAKSRAPLVSAVGHETDYTLTDLVADVRAPTPSAAGELVFPDRREMEKDLFYLSNRLDDALGLFLRNRHSLIEAIANREIWRKPVALLAQNHEACLYAGGQLARACEKYVQDRMSQLMKLEHAFLALDPRSVLKRGFAVVQDYDHGNIVSRASQVHEGQRLYLRFYDGKIMVTAMTVLEG